ncbi:MAG: hypothetical protein JNG88_01710 [Phycisphaerales bacterium]|nr:hypothetical protein [Phycisphaerales bacterium]
MASAALTSRETQDELLRQACAARLANTIQIRSTGPRNPEWPGAFVAYDSDGLWLYAPQLVSSDQALANERIDIHFQVGRAMRAVTFCVGRQPRTGPDGSPGMLVRARRPSRVEAYEPAPAFNLSSDALCGVSAALFDLDDARLTYSPRPLRLSNEQVVLAIDPPEEFRGGDLFQLQLAIPGQRMLATLFLRRRSTEFGRAGATITFSMIPGDEPQWAHEPLCRLAALGRSTTSFSSGGRVLLESCDVETPC